MSDKPNTVAIGAFVIGALLIVISTLLFIRGSGWGSNTEKYVMVFDGSIKGLTVGAPVALRGLNIGQVTNITLIFDTQEVDVMMRVEAEISNNRIQTKGTAQEDFSEEMIARGLRAQLNSQSLLTGLLYIELDFHPGTPLNMAAIESPYPQLPTIPTDLERFAQQIQSIDFAAVAENLHSMAEGLNSFITNPAFQSLPGQLQTSLAAVTAVSEQLNTQLLLTGPKLDLLLEGATTTMATTNSEMQVLSGSLQQSLEQFNTGIKAFESAMIEVDGLVSEDSATTYELNKALRELALAGRAIQLLAKTLEEQPEALLRGKSKER